MSYIIKERKENGVVERQERHCKEIQEKGRIASCTGFEKGSQFFFSFGVSQFGNEQVNFTAI